MGRLGILHTGFASFFKTSRNNETQFRRNEYCCNRNRSDIRPLSALSSDPEEERPLTPGHFLTGDALRAIPTPDLTTAPENRLSRWESTQAIQRFRSTILNQMEYFTRLQQRPKWVKTEENLKIEPGEPDPSLGSGPR